MSFTLELGENLGAPGNISFNDDLMGKCHREREKEVVVEEHLDLVIPHAFRFEVGLVRV